MNTVELGLRIKQCRKAQKITQEQLAEKVDISTHYLYEIERGSKSVSVAILAAIAEELHTSIDYLIFGEHAIKYDYLYTDELNELLIDLTPGEREQLVHVLRSLLPYLKL